MDSNTSHFSFSYYIVPLILCALLVMPCSLSYAQSDDDPQLESGTWALQFQVTDNFTLGAFEGSILSAKRQLSESRALRLGLDLSANSTSNNQGGSEDTQSNVGIKVDVQYLSYLKRDGAVRAYAGIGPTVGYNRSTSEGTAGAMQSEATRNEYRVGTVGVLGAEWFMRSNISLTAEYSARAAYATTSVENDDFDLDRDQWALGPRPVRFGVSVYF